MYKRFYRLFTDGRGYWLPNGMGYTPNLSDAGLFTCCDLCAYNLDGVKLISNENEA